MWLIVATRKFDGLIDEMIGLELEILVDTREYEEIGSSQVG
jgi:hypothetical protein